MASHCTNCGTKLSSKENFCPSCGKKLSNKKIIITIIVIICIIAIVLVSLAYLGNKPQTDNSLVKTNLNVNAQDNNFSSVSVSWKNNPFNLNNSVAAAELTITFNNTTTQTQNITFTLNYPNTELLEYCPTYEINNIEPKNTRTVTCFIRVNGEILSGTYSININSNIGNTTTNLEIIANTQENNTNQNKVKTGDNISVNYVGRLADGTIFDTSIGKSPLSFTVGTEQVISGFDKAVIGMKVGETKTVTLPPEQAYGAAGTNNNPLAGKTLVFEITIISINDSALPDLSTPKPF